MKFYEIDLEEMMYVYDCLIHNGVYYHKGEEIRFNPENVSVNFYREEFNIDGREEDWDNYQKTWAVDEWEIEKYDGD